MIGKIILLATVAAVSANTFHGVDPNTLACDPAGQVYLSLPHYSDCTRFFICAHGEEVPFTCPDGLFFEFEIQVCNWPTSKGCTLRNPPAEVSEEEAVIGSDEGSGDGSGWDEDINGQAGALTVPAIELPSASVHNLSDQGVSHLNCAVPNLSTKLAPYRGDCQRYWRCSNGGAEAAFCSDGLYFNPRTLACDFEVNVPCPRDMQLAQEELGEEFLPF